MPTWKPIPGETPIDISGLKPKNVTTRAQLNILEAENIRQAIMKYLAGKPTRRQAPFSLTWSCRLHRQMFGDVWKWAGSIRTTDLNLGVPSHRIQVDLQSLLDDLIYWRDHPGMPLTEQAARLHHSEVQIHPFMNGNGRWARLLANIWLKQCGGALTIWPEETIGNESVIRGDYLAAVRAADGGNYEQLQELHTRYAERAE